MNLSLNVGINQYDPHYYGGNVNLAQCVKDAHAFLEYADRRQFVPALMTDRLATVGAFSAKMKELAATMKRGDILLLTISGHGTYDDYIPMTSKQVKRMTGHCFTDGILWDFEFRELLRKFKPGTLVVKVSDACFAESNWRFMRFSEPYNEAKARFTRPRVIDTPPTPTQGDKRQIRCKYFDFASSNIYQVSYEDSKGGVFTTAILEALAKEPELSYYQLWRRASALIAPNYPQSPVFENVRAAADTGKRFLTL